MSELSSILQGRLFAYAEAKAQQRDVREFIVAGGLAAGEVERILSTLHAIARNRQAIDQHPQHAQGWLAGVFDSARAALPVGEVMQSAELGLGAEDISPTFARVARERLEGTVLHALAAEWDVVQALQGAVAEAPLVSEWLERALDHPADLDFAAVVASALLPVAVARASGPSLLLIETLTVAVDLALDVVKTAHHVSTGQLALGEGLERFGKRCAVALGTVVEQAIPLIAEKGGALLGMALGGLFGQAQLGAQVGAIVGRMAGARVAPAIGSALRAMAREVVDVVRGTVETVKGWIKGIFS